MLAKSGVLTGEKKSKGVNAVDALGKLLHVKVHAANQSDTKEGCAVFEQSALKYPSLKAFSADAGYCSASVEFAKSDSYAASMANSRSPILGRAVPPRRTVQDAGEGSGISRKAIPVSHAAPSPRRETFWRASSGEGRSCKPSYTPTTHRGSSAIASRCRAGTRTFSPSRSGSRTFADR